MHKMLLSLKSWIFHVGQKYRNAASFPDANENITNEGKIGFKGEYNYLPRF